MSKMTAALTPSHWEGRADTCNLTDGPGDVTLSGMSRTREDPF